MKFAQVSMKDRMGKKLINLDTIIHIRPTYKEGNIINGTTIYFAGTSNFCFAKESIEEILLIVKEFNCLSEERGKNKVNFLELSQRNNKVLINTNLITYIVSAGNKDGDGTWIHYVGTANSCWVQESYEQIVKMFVDINLLN